MTKNYMYLGVSLPGKERALSFEHEAFNRYINPSSPNFNRDRGDLQKPAEATFGFRQAFFKQFENIYEYPISIGESVCIDLRPNIGEDEFDNTSSFNLIIKSFAYLSAVPNLCLDNNEDYLLVICMECDEKFQSYFAKAKKANERGKEVLQQIDNWLRERNIDVGISKALEVRGNGYIGFNWHSSSYNFDECKCEKAILKNTTDFEESKNSVLCKNCGDSQSIIFDRSLFFANYYLGWLYLQRLVRHHIDLELIPVRKATYGEEILKSRMLIANLERLCLTHNRSKNSDITDFADEVVRGFGFVDRLDKSKSVQSSLEQHLNNYSAIEQTKKAQRTNSILMAFTIGSIAIALFSVAFTEIKENSLAYNPDNLLENPILSVGLGSFALVICTAGVISTVHYLWQNSGGIMKYLKACFLRKGG